MNQLVPVAIKIHQDTLDEQMACLSDHSQQKPPNVLITNKAEILAQRGGKHLSSHQQDYIWLD